MLNSLRRPRPTRKKAIEIDGAVQNGKVTERAEPLEDTYPSLEPLLPVIVRLRYSAKLYPIVQDVDWEQAIPFYTSSSSWRMTGDACSISTLPPIPLLNE
jgi:hypothetical protein